MKILVLGAGAVGGYFGGRMAEAGADVTFLVRPKRAELLAKGGLRIKSKTGDLKLAAKCIVEAQVKPDYDVVMFTAKAYDLASAIDAIAPAVAGNKRGHVLPLLNGMSHLDALDARFGRERILGGVAYIASTLAPDGVIQHLNDFQRIVFGPRTASQQAVCEALSAALAGVKFDWKQLDNVEQAMWDKWVLLATLAGITCLMRAAVGDIVATGAGEKLVLALLAENASVAKAESIRTLSETASDFMPGKTITNSSPPKRAVTSCSRINFSRPLANTCSTRLPAWWPKRSFTCLKPSKSQTITVSGCSCRLHSDSS